MTNYQNSQIDHILSHTRDYKSEKKKIFDIFELKKEKRYDKIVT